MAKPIPVLVAYAEGAAGEAAFKAASREALMMHTTLTVVHKLVGTEVPDRFGPTANGDIRGRVALLKIHRKARENAQGLVQVNVRTVAGDIAQELILASMKSSLLVLGMTATNSFASAAFDTVPRAVVRRAHCPVLLVPPHPDEQKGAPVICGIDRSAASVEALRWAAAEAERRGVTVRAVEILGDRTLRISRANTVAPLQTWVCDHLHASGTSVMCSTEFGRASHRLLEIAREDHGLLVIGARERQSWKDASVCRVATAQTRVPVVVVPLATRRATDQSIVERQAVGAAR